MFHLASTVALMLLLLGWRYRSNPRRHRTLMIAAFLLDLTLVVVIEIRRGVIGDVAQTISPFVYFHAVVSILVLLLYVIQLLLGAALFA